MSTNFLLYCNSKCDTIQSEALQRGLQQHYGNIIIFSCSTDFSVYIRYASHTYPTFKTNAFEITKQHPVLIRKCAANVLQLCVCVNSQICQILQAESKRHGKTVMHMCIDNNRHSTTIIGCPVQLCSSAEYENRQSYFSISMYLPRVMHSGQPSKTRGLLCSQIKSSLYACSRTVCVGIVRVISVDDAVYSLL